MALALAVSVARCGSSSPTGPNGSTLVVFSDPAGGFSTSDVLDSNGDLVRFDSASELIWVATGTAYPGYPTSGNFVGSSNQFEIRFGTSGGQRHAYFTETTSGTICDVSVPGGQLTIAPTTVPVPK